MDAAELARVQTSVIAEPRVAVVADEHQSQWVVDVASGRVIRRQPAGFPAERANPQRV